MVVGLTFPKYLSRTSTYRWMISSVTSSLSDEPIPQTKKSDAYRRYTTLVSMNLDQNQTWIYPVGTRSRMSGFLCRWNITGVASPWPPSRLTKINRPLYSRKLHIRVRRARTSCVTSLTIFALTLGAIVVNHFAKRTLPIDPSFNVESKTYWTKN